MDKIYTKDETLTKELKCPLMHSINNNAACITNECAWFNSESKECGILSLTKCLEAIQ